MMCITSSLLHKYTFVLMIRALSTHIRIFLETKSFFRFRIKYASTRTSFESFYAVHTKTLKRWKYECVPYKSCTFWCVQKPPLCSLHTKISKPVFFLKKFHSQARFRKPAFFASENAVVDLLTGSNLHFCLVLNHLF